MEIKPPDKSLGKEELWRFCLEICNAWNEEHQPVIALDRAVPAPVVTNPEWSNQERPVRDWEPDPYLPDKYFRDDKGIRQNISKGEVPRDVLERFGYLKEEEETAKNEEQKQLIPNTES